MHLRFCASWRVLFLLLLSAVFLSACSGSSPGPGAEAEAKLPENTAAGNTAAAEKGEAEAGGQSGVRPNTPVVYEPQAPLESTLGEEPLIVDISHTDQGYVMARYTGSAAKANIQITGPDGIHYKYFLTPSDSFISLPLTSGDGTYQIDGYENIAGTQYAVLFRETTEVSLENELFPFL